MADEVLYGGLAVVDDDDDGDHYLVTYLAHEKDDFQADVERGSLEDGRRIVVHEEFFDKPSTFAEIKDLSSRLFTDSYRPGAEK